MGKTLQLFDFNNNNIRVIDMGGEPWFPAKDVCDVLKLKNPQDAVKSACVEGEAQFVAKSNIDSISVSYPNRGMLCVNESGLYALIFASRKPEARAFKHWVTSTVLPAIRKDGGYIMGEEKVATGEFGLS